MSKFEITEEIPVKSFSIAAFIVKRNKGRAKYLIIRRVSETFTGIWQMVSGKVEKGENAVQATLREIKEETGLIPKQLYSANLMEQFYDINYNVINLVPVFLAVVNDECEVVLEPKEHDEYKWIYIEEVKEYLDFEQQIKNINKIDEFFIKREPVKYLEVDLKKISNE